MGNPVYHLRPNKAVDRNLFVESLLKLEKVYDLSQYRYIGFGSYEFDDFKLMYKSLGLIDLHSIEMDTDIFKRQQFNKPYPFVRLFNKTCGEYIDEDFDETKPTIIWLDFSEANKKHDQCKDIANICGKIKKGDILRITLNANPANIPLLNGHPESTQRDVWKIERFDWLKKELGEFFPEETTADNITKKNYPVVLLKMIKKAVYDDLDCKLFACPICSYVYSDNTQMMTVSIVFENAENKETSIKRLKEVFNGWEDYVNVGEWDKTIGIALPSLTIGEQLKIRQKFDDEEAMRQMEENMGISRDDIYTYLRFARYYPNYQPIIL